MGQSKDSSRGGRRSENCRRGRGCSSFSTFSSLELYAMLLHSPRPRPIAAMLTKICHTGRQEVCEDAVEWDCHNATRFIVYGADVEICNPTMRNVCTQKTRYEPEEYEEEECTKTTEEVCIWNYDTVVTKHNVSECSTVYEQMHQGARATNGDHQGGAALHLQHLHQG